MRTGKSPLSSQGRGMGGGFSGSRTLKGTTHRMPTDITRFYEYDELTEILRSLEKQYPKLAKLESIGQSFEGRDIWLLTITNQETGAHDEKPAMYIDGNIHAGEVTG